jgi:hypothetical protein
LVWSVTLQFFNAILLREVRGAILEILSKINRVDFFNYHDVKIPKTPHVKFKKLITAKIIRGYMPFSQLKSNPYTMDSCDKKYEQCLSGCFLPEVPP